MKLSDTLRRRIHTLVYVLLIGLGLTWSVALAYYIGSLARG